MKVSEIYKEFQGKPLYKRVYKKELGYAVSELNETGHKLMEILETQEIENDTGSVFNPTDYFRLMMK